MKSSTITLFIILPFVLALLDTNSVKIKPLLFDAVSEFNCGCILVVVPDNLSIKRSAVLNRFARGIARGLGNETGRRMIQVGMTSFQGLLKTRLRGINLRSETCFKVLVILLGQEMGDSQLKEITRKGMLPDTVWLTFLNSSHTTQLGDIEPQYDSRFYVANEALHSEEVVEITEIYRVSENSPNRVQQIAVWTIEDGLRSTAPGRFTRRKNLEGHIFRAANINETLVTTYISTPKGPIVVGLFPDIWRELGKLLNFSSVHYRSVDFSPGSKIGNGNWTGIMGMIDRGEADVALEAMEYTVERLEVLRFLLPLDISRFQVFFRLGSYQVDWLGVFRPLSWVIWLCGMIWILMASAAFIFGDRISRACGLEENRESSSWFYFFLLLQTVCQQGTSYVPRSDGLRFLFVVCYLYGTLMFTAYSGQLISSLTQRKPRRPYDSLAELQQSGDKVLVASSTSDYDFFKYSQDDVVKKIYEKQIRPYESIMNTSDRASVVRGVKLLCEHSGYAGVSSEKIANYVLMRINSNCHMARFSKPIYQISQSIALKKDSPYINVINYNILRLYERGILTRLKRKYSPPVLKPKDSLIVVTLSDVLEVFVFLSTAMVTSVMILVFERTQKKIDDGGKSGSNYTEEDDTL